MEKAGAGKNGGTHFARPKDRRTEAQKEGCEQVNYYKDEEDTCGKGESNARTCGTSSGGDQRLAA